MKETRFKIFEVLVICIQVTITYNYELINRYLG